MCDGVGRGRAASSAGALRFGPLMLVLSADAQVSVWGGKGRGRGGRGNDARLGGGIQRRRGCEVGKRKNRQLLPFSTSVLALSPSYQPRLCHVDACVHPAIPTGRGCCCC
ncbi:hypothetical protein GALMADRAFT_592693 [Galerina marginata CBS 339.88]|uniref:Secreted protein n=1 Tax=Galerina marginata (strain CBS 339.88) TaxID=685588 RepID=A0A067T1N8_GALM3|nr:hypothetical protein GALMADRAFT_592693 [Galerina marginata CBS 339.88]